MEATILLADAAQTTPDGKIHALGLGWAVTVTPLPPQAIVVLIRVPWDQSNDPHTAVMELHNADGQLMTVPGPLGEQPMRMQAEFETGRPPGIPKGTPLQVPLAISVGSGLPLQPGRYEWRLTIDGGHEDDWRAGFLVRAATPQAP